MDCIDARNFLPQLQDVVDQGLHVLIWAGDADWICNWKGNLYTADHIVVENGTFKDTELATYKVKGQGKGEFKTLGNLSFLRVYKAGHTVPAYRKYKLRTFYGVSLGNY